MLQVNMPEAFKIEYRELPIPKIGNDDVLVQMKRVGVCGSDIQIYHGKHNYMKSVSYTHLDVYKRQE